MSERPFRALVVDDDLIARRMVSHGLGCIGFDCDNAKDGAHALEMIQHATYDLVVTDLCMPKKNGHSLAVALLNRDARPLVIIHTSVDDPRITKDLLARGVDDIVYKPTNYESFAARAKMLVERQGAGEPLGHDGRMSLSGTKYESLNTSNGSGATGPRPGLSASDGLLNDSDLANMLPMSEAAMNVYRLALSEDCEPREIAKAIEVDAALAAQLLIIGNSFKYNLFGDRTTDLEQLVVRIGHRSIGEWALADAVRVASGRHSIPWIDLDLMWHRSVAAGLAVEALAPQSDANKSHSELFLSALFSPLGRIVLASAYPKQHSNAALQAEMNNERLDLVEASLFGRFHTTMLADLLEQRNVSAKVTASLRNILDDYDALQTLPAADRERAELLKLAILVANVAVGRWQKWDTVECPPLDVLRRLKVHSLGSVIEKVRYGLNAIVSSQATVEAADESPPLAEPLSIGYFSLDMAGYDFIASILPSMGLQPNWENLGGQSRVCLNCLGADPALVAKVITAQETLKMVFLAGQGPHDELEQLGTVVALPISYGCLMQICRGRD